MEKDLPTSLIPTGAPPDVPEGKTSPEWKKGRNQHVLFRRETFSFIFLLELQQATPAER
jgi:hypothetical protein